MKQEMIIVLDFGGQYNQLIARRVRECGVYCEVLSYQTPIEELIAKEPKGIILTGGPNSVYDETSPHYDKALFETDIPIPGICYGAQLMAYSTGGKVETATTSEYGKTDVKVTRNNSLLFGGVENETVVWMSHTDMITELGSGFVVTAHTDKCPVAAMENAEKKLYAVQYHPEVTHSIKGQQMLSNFVYDVCGCKGDWKMVDFTRNTIEEIKKRVGDGKVLCALSGGVDSSVAAVLLSKAVGKNLTCVFVDHGLLRKNEAEEVERIFGDEGEYDLNFVHVKASERFYEKLAGVSEPEAKRKIIGEEFIRVFEEEAKKIGAVDYLVQGTIYPDVIESGLGKSKAITMWEDFLTMSILRKSSSHFACFLKMK